MRRLLLVGLALLAAGCTSPEATRARGGGPGGDVGNVGDVVRIHAGALPYHDTPRLIEPHGLDDLSAAQQADRLAREAGPRR